jgi:hypothetical protein
VVFFFEKTAQNTQTNTNHDYFFYQTNYKPILNILEGIMSQIYSLFEAIKYKGVLSSYKKPQLNDKLNCQVSMIFMKPRSMHAETLRE